MKRFFRELFIGALFVLPLAFGIEVFAMKSAPLEVQGRITAGSFQVDSVASQTFWVILAGAQYQNTTEIVQILYGANSGSVLYNDDFTSGIILPLNIRFKTIKQIMVQFSADVTTGTLAITAGVKQGYGVTKNVYIADGATHAAEVVVETDTIDIPDMAYDATAATWLFLRPLSTGRPTTNTLTIHRVGFVTGP